MCRFLSYIQIKGRNVLKLLADMYGFCDRLLSSGASSRGFLFSFLSCSQQQEELAKFGYRSDMKVEKFEESCFILTICSNQVTLAHFFHKYPWNESHWIISLVTKWWELSKKRNSELIIRYAFKPKSNFFQKKSWKQDFQDFLLSVWMYIQNKAESQHKMPLPPLYRKFKLATFYTRKCSMKLFSPKRKTIITPHLVNIPQTLWEGGAGIRNLPLVASSKFKATTFT